MSYERLLSHRPEDSDSNLHATSNFLVKHFGALQIQHPLYNNLVLLGAKSYWVKPATSKYGVELCDTRQQESALILDELKKIRAGFLILRQMPDNRLCIYLMDRLDKIEYYCQSSLTLLWDDIDKAVSFSDSGIVVGNELIGFRKLSQKLKAPVIPIKPHLVKLKRNT